MEGDSLAYMRRCLEELEPLEPVSTGAEPRLPMLRGIQAVLFDVYGTLLVSASAALSCLQTASARIPREKRRATGARAVEVYRERIREIHRHKREQGIPHPEVDVIEIWRDVVEVLQQQGLIFGGEEVDCRRLAFCFETKSNPVYPMPGMAEQLGALREKGFLLGIVSNAQFFTPITLAHFLTPRTTAAEAAATGTQAALPAGAGSPAADSPGERIPLFDPDLVVFSYRYGRAKPDTWLFEEAARRLRRRSISPERAVYIGNDMLKDVHAARSVGFRTLLFAGDRRSLRLRPGEVDDTEPDGVITELPQLAGLW